ncbi:MAG: HAMP domain-containing histidine kinase [Anaerolineae bacterium]|nr:HAMP domain-containing histidine kinase [Anaerolineae bacterium]
MVILDLQWVLFVALCAAILTIGGVVWALRETGARHRRASGHGSKTDDTSDELQRAQRASRSLISNLGHELRTPIATLLTHIEILGLDDVGDDVHTQSLQLAKREAQRMSRLVNDMLELGRLEMTETLTRRPLSLLALVEDVVAQTMPRAVAGNVTVDIVSPPTLPLVLGNTDRLRQVLLNLLDNAFKYAGAGSRATIELSTATGGVVCTICDTGPGIPPEHLPFVTQRFYRAAAETVEGSGLGLALVAEILRHHGSELEITSSVADDTGTCVRFVLPPAAPTGGE